MSGSGECKKRYGIALFVLLAVVLGAIAVVATGITGPMGIEERFTSAVGLHQESASPGETGTGFSIEGHPLLYAALLAVLLVASYFIYRRYRL
jgi:hypothetical protein